MKIRYHIDGMKCNGCRSHVENALKDLDGIENASVNLEKKEAEIDFNKEISTGKLQEAIGERYSIKPVEAQASPSSPVAAAQPAPTPLVAAIRPAFGGVRKIYSISGMSCSGCSTHVEGILKKVPGLTSVSVNLEKAEAEVLSPKEIPLSELKHWFEEDGGHYGIHEEGYKVVPKKKTVPPKNFNGVYYCPMHCEGDKTYDKPGSCPICGMDLVPLASSGAESGSKEEQSLQRKFWLSVAFTLPIFLISMGEMVPHNKLYEWFSHSTLNWVQLVLSLPVVFYTGRMFFERAWRSIRNSHYNMFTLIGIGAGVAWIFSVLALLFPDFFPEQFKSHGSVHVYFEATTVILTLVLLGQLMEARAHRKTQDAVKSLLDLIPAKAYKIVDGKEVETDIQEIEKGDLLRVKPGDKVPVDGTITDGESVIDESMITGEPVPVDKKEGDKVTSGTINGSGSFVFRAEKVGDETLLSQIVEMVNTASRSQAPVQKLADKISSYFVPVVVGVSVLTFILWAAFGPEPTLAYALVNAIAVLIIACPCALGLATPMSVMVGVGKGAHSGVLIKNAEALQQMAKVNTLVIDKTGTLTEGKPSVEKFVNVSSLKDNDFLQLILAVNSLSTHPLAKATVDFAVQKGIPSASVTDFRNVTGQGVTAIFNAKTIFLGNESLLTSNGISIPNEIKDQADDYRENGKTVSFLALGQELLGFIVLSDKIKSSARNAIKELKRKGLDIVILTGDNELTARYVAEELGVEHYRAGLLPQDKLTEVEKLQQQGHIVAMAGDGINDAPALAKSDVGIAMGTGTNAAIESAKITLLKGDLQGIVKAVKLSEAVMKNIKENLFFALFYNSIGVPVAAGILFPFFGILLSPMLAAVAMSFSSVSVISNALRLKTVKLDA